MVKVSLMKLQTPRAALQGRIMAMQARLGCVERVAGQNPSVFELSG